MKVKTSEAETGGLCIVWEGQVGPGSVGARPHYHRGRDEFFYVLGGEVALRIDEEKHTVATGTFAFVPRETIHGFHNASSTNAILLIMHHPAGFERYLEEMQQLAARHGGRRQRATLAARFDVIPVPASTDT